MKRYITSLGLLLIIKVSLAQEDVIDACEDVAGVKHKKDDSYIGPDGCNRCKCLEGGSACTKRLCPKVDYERGASCMMQLQLINTIYFIF